MWNDIQKLTGSNPNVAKYVFTKDDAVAEAVLYKYPTYKERTVICCSTMSGCMIGCRFCGSGDYFVRKLTGPEILDQVCHLIKETGIHSDNIDKLQVMFMSMGEPMLNMDQVIFAMRKLNMWYNLLPAKQHHIDLLVSTVAPRVDYEPFIEISTRIPKIGLQFSIHETTDEARNKLIPFKAKLSLSEIAKLGETWYHRTNRVPFLNYCANEHNTTDDDCDRLVELFDPHHFNLTVSVVCEREETVAAANDRQRELASSFSGRMVERGFNVRVFDPAGQDDIGGGCGQLWFVQDWMRKNPELARPSVGHGLVKIHTPRPD